MQLSFTVFAVLVATVSAQTSAIPACALACLTPQYLGTCPVPTANDQAATIQCVCDTPAVQQALGQCIIQPVDAGGCSTDDQAGAIIAVQGICAAASGSGTGGASETGVPTGSGSVSVPTGTSSGAVPSGSSTPRGTTTHASTGPSATNKPPGDSASKSGAGLAVVAAVVIALAI